MEFTHVIFEKRRNLMVESFNHIGFFSILVNNIQLFKKMYMFLKCSMFLVRIFDNIFLCKFCFRQIKKVNMSFVWVASYAVSFFEWNSASFNHFQNCHIFLYYFGGGTTVFVKSFTNGFGLPQKWEANGSRSACGDWKGRGGSWGLNKTSSCAVVPLGSKD